MQCPGCRVDNPSDRSHCESCGAPLSLVCVACGTVSPLDKNFCGECAAPLASAVPEAGGVEPESRANGHAAERRHLTVVFCDLIGSTELSTRLDPEEVRQVNRSYREVCSAIVARYDGLIASYMGDGIMVYFGYQSGHEDDAERAVRAALAAVAAVGELEPLPGVALRMRVGIASGVVVAGDLVGDGIAEKQAVSGETPNLAARLQGLADPEAVVIDERTHRLLGGLFEYESLGAQRLKGMSEPVPCWRVLRERKVGSRFVAARGGGVLPCVGREEEIGLFLERWRRTQQGQGQILLVSGEAGIGKSRVIELLRERIAEERHVRLRFQCSPYHVASSLHPFIEQLERTARFAPDDAAEQKLDKLEAFLSDAASPVSELAPLLAPLLSIPTGDRYPPLQLSPQQRKEKLFELLVGDLERRAAEQPTLMLVEDVHWIDPTTLELLDLVAERLQGARLLLVVTSRPDTPLRLAERPNATSLTLRALDRRHSLALVGMVAEGKALPPEVLEWIVDRTDGVPLFVEELTKAILESDLLREEDDRYVLRGPLSDPAIPSTLQDSLEARLDRLGDAKEVAQIGAVIGREFPCALLAAVSRRSAGALEEAVDRLVDAGLGLRRGAPPQETFAFKHALIRDVAYESLLRSERRALHAHIAERLEAEFPERAETEPEVVAHHLTAAGRFDQAVTYWRRAGAHAAERSANAEAAEHFRQALRVVEEHLPEGRPRDELELELQIALAGALIGARGYSAPETEQSYARALALCMRIGETPQIFPVLYGRWVFHIMAGVIGKAHALARDFLHLAERQQVEDQLLVAHRVLGTSLVVLGKPEAAREQLDRALALYDAERHQPLIFRYGQDVRVSGLCYKALAMWLLGCPEQALQLGDEAIERARALSHPNSLAYTALHVGALLRALCGDAKETLRWAEWLHEAGVEHQLPIYEASWGYFAGAAFVEAKEEARGLVLMRESRERLQAIQSRYMLPILSTFHARGCAALGLVDEGLAILDAGRDLMEARGERWFESELHRARGDLLASDAAAHRGEATACLRRALDVARVQGARGSELRAATSLARVLRDGLEQAEARETLAPVLASFDEGFELPDLRRAQELLDELG